MKTHRTPLAILAFGTMLSATGAHAQPRPGGPPPLGGPAGPPPHGEHGDALASYLGLSDAQKASAAALKEQLHSTTDALREQERTAHETLRAALESGSRDAAALGALVLQGHDVHQKVKAAHDGYDAAFAALLTAEQKAKWEAARAAREALRPAGGPGGPHGPAGPRARHGA